MSPNLPETKEGYQTHRDNQRERILEAAEKLFIQEGIDNVSISAIAGAARISRRTMYQYFPDKQEVAWAIFQKLVERTKAVLTDQNIPGENGFQRLENLLMKFIGSLEENPAHARFIVEFNTLYARERSSARISEVYQRTSQMQDNLFVDAVRQGIADGSIRADLDPGLVTAAMLNMTNAVVSRFALLGGLIGEEYGQPTRLIYREIYRVFLLGIRSPGKP